MSITLLLKPEEEKKVFLALRKTRVRPGSIAYWVLRFFDRRDLFEFKLFLFCLVMLCGGMP